MPSEKDNILELNQHMKSYKMSYIIYADIESLIKKIEGCANNPEESSTTKIGKHIYLILKKRCVTFNKRRTRIISKCKIMLHLWEKNLKKAL